MSLIKSGGGLLRWWEWLAPPHSCDEEQLRIGRAVRLLAVSGVLGIVPPLLLQWMHGWRDEFRTLAGAELALLATLWLNHRGYTAWASRTLTLTALACSAGLVYFSGHGYQDLSLLLFPVILVIAALLLSWRVYVCFTFVLILLVSVLILLQINGLNPNTPWVQGSYSDLLMIGIILTITSLSAGLLAAALKRSLSDYRTLIEQQGEGIVVLDRDYRIRMANPSAAGIFLLPREIMRGRLLQDFVPAEEWAAVEHETAKCRAGERVAFEMNAQRADGARRSLLVTCTPRLSADGEWSGSIVVLRDVTEAREAEEKMRLLAHALQSTDNCVCITDVENRIEYVNDAFVATYGYAEAELLGQRIGIVGSNRNPPSLEAGILLATLEDGWSGELWTRAKDGREFLISLIRSVVRDERGRVIATVGVGRDLTERKAVEGALHESERRFQALLQHVNLAAVIVDLEGNISFCNDLVLAAIGRSREEVIGRRAVEFLAPESRDQHLKRLEEATRFGGPEPVTESGVMGANGGCRWFQWSNTALLHSDGQPAGWACLGFEVTEQRALREQYLQAQKLESMGRLAGGVAHDFNNLLTVINGFAELQLMQANEGSVLRHNLELILKAGEQAAALCHQLLAFSRKQASQPKAVDLNQAIGEVQELLSRTLGENIEVVARLNPELGLVMADPNHMQQVLVNLVVNARDAMPSGGSLTLATANLKLAADAAGQHPGVPPGSYVHLVVADNGTGMSKEVLGRIFEPFFTTKEGGKGSGLGLATVYGIVRQSGGWIRVWSELGRGSAFHLYLPLIKAPSAIEKTREKTSAEVSGSETILVVEDQASVLEFVKTALEGYGYRILSALDGPAAIVLARAYPEKIDLLLTDLVMPGMDGRQLAENLMKARPEMRILYMTGYALRRSGSQGLAEPSSNCIRKPFKPRVLAARVREALTASV